MEQRLKEALDYFRARPVYEKLFRGMWEKAQSLGHFGGSVTLSGLRPEEKELLEGFFQKSFRGKNTVTISAAAMMKALENSRFAGLDWTEVLEAYFQKSFLGTKERRAQEDEKRSAFFARFLSSGEDGLPSRFSGWMAATLKNRGTGWQLLGRLYQEDSEKLAQILEALQRAEQCLPMRDEKYLPLPVFAANVTGNPHFFDEGTPAGRLLLLWLSDLFSLEYEEEASGLEWKNRMLYRAGILKDGLSNHTLFYGIRAKQKDGLWHMGIEGFYQKQEPLQCTLQTLGGIAQAKGEPVVYVVENPAVFAALVNRYPKRSFVCTNGQPQLASLVLLDLLAKESLLKYAGDFDPEGLKIAQNLKHRYKDRMEYWGYERAYYERAVSEVRLSENRLKKMDAVQDEGLLAVADAIREKKRAAYQEAMLGFAYEIESEESGAESQEGRTEQKWSN